MDWKEIFIWLFIFVVGSLIVYAILYNPSNITSAIDKIKSSVKTEAQALEEQDSSVTSCLNEIKEKIRIAEAKSLVDMNIYIKEYKKFDNTQDAINYLEEWDYEIIQWGVIYLYPELLEKKGNEEIIHKNNNIIIALVRFEGSDNQRTFGALAPVICINGTMTESSERHFKTSFF